ncbi:hypothetical protein DN619_26510 [Klebsiella michiganensis]|uniref:Uncharacterized protein n=3 Tax=Enterobacterales TaxID=91347 RepID=A0A443VHI3_RAOPL|nr:hypothetical protein [Salmonella enterica subsp. enterica serovar Agona]RAY62701.1 hypothetical protein DP186_00140 [Enterobacter hormaechei subsp. xiangfangensis]RWS52014.1 hypothetical protein DN586_24560 [Enterobacter cloacae]RWT18911.1 hypothetical protein DN603_22550 [Raoultella planticola]RWT38632.1 hypothetical protein DN619_26510 [Klebsiella michiganensis]HAS1738618.1 hypothetical protein [Enterobacter hormaechei subsp. oharae]HCK00984.1 hypothetical protein [Serratia grimesii]
MFSESGFTHNDLLKEYNQYVGRFSKFNDSFCRDTYSCANRKDAKTATVNIWRKEYRSISS